MHKTLAQLLACAQRELALRFNTYPRWVEQGRLKPDTASHEIECMKSIVAVLEQQRDLAEVTAEITKLYDDPNLLGSSPGL